MDSFLILLTIAIFVLIGVWYFTTFIKGKFNIPKFKAIVVYTIAAILSLIATGIFLTLSGIIFYGFVTLGWGHEFWSSTYVKGAGVGGFLFFYRMIQAGLEKQVKG